MFTGSMGAKIETSCPFCLASFPLRVPGRAQPESLSELPPDRGGRASAQHRNRLDRVALGADQVGRESHRHGRAPASIHVLEVCRELGQTLHPLALIWRELWILDRGLEHALDAEAFRVLDITADRPDVSRLGAFDTPGS